MKEFKEMSSYERLRSRFVINWTTILVGWNGLGVLSPWPDRWKEFPTLISCDEISSYASERLVEATEQEDLRLITELLSPVAADRDSMRETLLALSRNEKGDPDFELRKWRLVLLEQLIEGMPKDVVQALLALTEFWQGFGFPRDCPHEAQGRGNTISAAEYYRQDTLERLMARHREWMAAEESALKSQRTSFSKD